MAGLRPVYKDLGGARTIRAIFSYLTTRGSVDLNKADPCWSDKGGRWKVV